MAAVSFWSGWRRVAFLGASALAGVGAAALAIALLGWATTPQAAALRLPKSAIGDNRRPLSPSEVATLVRWATRYRACAAHRGLQLGQPEVSQNEIVLRARHGGVSLPELQRGFACAREIGDPPFLASFVLERDHELHLYRARACLLPVVRSNGKTA